MTWDCDRLIDYVGCLGVYFWGRWCFFLNSTNSKDATEFQTDTPLILVGNESDVHLLQYLTDCGMRKLILMIDCCFSWTMGIFDVFFAMLFSCPFFGVCIHWSKRIQKLIWGEFFWGNFKLQEERNSMYIVLCLVITMGWIHAVEETAVYRFRVARGNRGEK